MKEKKKAVTYRIRESTIEKVRKRAKSLQATSINDFVDFMVNDWLETNPVKK